MALVTFEAISISLLGGAGEYERAVPRLSYEVRLAQEQSVQLTTNEKFNDLEGHCVVYADTESAPPIRENATGLISYHPAQEDYSSNYYIQVWVSRASLDELLAVARIGR